MASITHNDIAYAIHSSIKGKEGKELDELLTESVKLLAEHRLISQSNIIVSKVQALIDIDNGITRARVLSPRSLELPVQAEIVRALKERYHSASVVLEEVMAPELIGGIKIEVGDEVIDASLKYKVKELQDYLIKN